MRFILQRFRSLPYPVQIILLAATYFALGRIGFLFAVVHDNVSLVWPPAGIALVAILLLGYQLWPGIVLGAFLVNLSNGAPLAASMVIGMGNTLASLTGAYLLLRFAHFQTAFERLQDVVSFVILGAVASTILAATIGVAALCSTGVTPWTEYGSAWWIWWGGDAIGVLIVTPFLLTWGASKPIPISREQRFEMVVLLVIMTIISALVFATPLATAGFYPLAYLTFPFLGWAAFRFGIREVAAGSFLMWIVAAWGTTQQTGPFVRANVEESLIFAWSYIGTVSVTALLLAAAIGERKRSEASLRESQARLQAILENLPFEVWARDAGGRCVLQNPASVALWGDMIGKRLDDLEFPEATLAEWKELNERAFAGEVLHSENEIDVQGERRAYFYIVSPIRDANGIQGILGTNIDITEQKQAEIALRKSEERFAQAFHANPSALSISTLENGVLVDVNQEFLNLLGFERDEVIGRTSTELNMIVAPSSRAQFAELLRQHQHIPPGEATIRDKAGNLRQIRYAAQLIEAEGKPHILTMWTDITEQKRAETALRESEERFRAIFERSSVGIIVVDRRGYAVSVNPAFERMVGYSEAELRQMPFSAFTHPDDIVDNLDHFGRLHRGEIDHYQMDKRYLRKDGSLVWTRINVSPVLDSRNPDTVSVALVEDITEHQLAEAALRESEARFRAIYEGATIGVVMFGPDGYPVSTNPAFQRMLGYSGDELRQMRFRSITHPDDIEPTISLFQRLQAGELNHYYLDKRYIRKDGGIVWAQINVSALENASQHGSFAVALIEDITERKVAEAALRESEARNAALLDAIPDLMFLLDKNGVFLDYRAPDVSSLFVPPESFLGKSVYEVLPEAITAPLRLLISRAIETRQVQFYEYSSPDPDNPSIYESRLVAFGDDKILIMSREITERKRAETAIQELNADLERRVAARTAELAAANQRLTELDRLKSKFIADVSHELRTPLAVLNTRVYLLEKGLPEKRAEYLIGLRDQIERLSQFVNTILDLSRLDLGKGKIEFAPVNLNDVVDQVTAALAPRAEANGLRLTVHCENELPSVRGEFNQLAQVATNLIANAIKYTANGRIEVSTGLEGEGLYLRVQDTGMGITPDDLPHLFERFYRGERAGQSQISGSGLGLSIVKEIVDLHGGEIQVESEVGKGSAFTVRLPLWKGELPETENRL